MAKGWRRDGAGRGDTMVCVSGGFEFQLEVVLPHWVNAVRTTTPLKAGRASGTARADNSGVGTKSRQTRSCVRCARVDLTQPTVPLSMEAVESTGELATEDTLIVKVESVAAMP